MCRYSMKEYKTSFVCLRHRHVAQFPKGTTPRCPVCREPMMHMGREFKAPRKTDDKAWKRLAEIAFPGRFDSCGC